MPRPPAPKRQSLAPASTQTSRPEASASASTPPVPTTSALTAVLPRARAVASGAQDGPAEFPSTTKAGRQGRDNELVSSDTTTHTPEGPAAPRPCSSVAWPSRPAARFYLAVLAPDKTVRIWRLNTAGGARGGEGVRGQLVGKAEGFKSLVWSLAWSPVGPSGTYLAVGTVDSAVRLQGAHGARTGLDEAVSAGWSQQYPNALDQDLRELLVRYAQLAQVTYDNLGQTSGKSTFGYPTVAACNMLDYLTPDYPLRPGAPPVPPCTKPTKPFYFLPTAAGQLSPVIYAQPGLGGKHSTATARLRQDPRALEVFNAIYEADGDIDKAADALRAGGKGEEAESLLAVKAELDSAIFRRLSSKADVGDVAARVAENDSDDSVPQVAKSDVDKAIGMLDVSPRDDSAMAMSSSAMALDRDLPKLDYDFFWVPIATLATQLFFGSKPLLQQNPPPPRSTFMGFVAVSQPSDADNPDSGRDAVFVWRGTIFKEEWAVNCVQDKLVIPDFKDGKCQDAKALDVGVHDGFHDLYMRKTGQHDPSAEPTAPRDVVTQWLRKLQEEYNITTVTTTGHSLGGALSTLSAYDIALQLEEMWKDPKLEAARQTWQTKAKPTVTAITFAAPRVGNLPFRMAFRDLKVKQLRVCNVKDIVPKVPGDDYNRYDDDTDSKAAMDKDAADLAGMKKPPLWSIKPKHLVARLDFHHVGTLLKVNSNKDFVDHSGKPLGATDTVGKHHNLEVYLHFLDKKGAPGNGTNRNPLLLNKSDEILLEPAWKGDWWHDPAAKDYYQLPDNGRWQHKTKTIT